MKAFFTPQDFSLQTTLTLTEEESHHVKVMRLKEKDEISLINGKGQKALAIITKIEKKEVEAKIIKISKENPTLPITLYMAFIDPTRLEWIVEKALEIGVTQFVFFKGQKSEAKKIKEERLHKIFISSLKQCERLFLPKICIEKDLFSLSFPPQGAFFGDLRKEAPELFQVFVKTSSYSIIIGPESGFSKEEIAFLDEKKIPGITLSTHTLRCDSAAIVAFSELFMLLRKEGLLTNF